MPNLFVVKIFAVCPFQKSVQARLHANSGREMAKTTPGLVEIPWPMPDTTVISLSQPAGLNYLKVAFADDVYMVLNMPGYDIAQGQGIDGRVAGHALEGQFFLI